MKSLNRSLLLSLMLAPFLLSAARANATALTLTFSSPLQYADAGDLVTFDATVTNTTGSTVYLNGDDFSLDSPLTLDDSSYFNNFPLTLAASGSFTGALFTVDVPLGTAPGIYAGTFDITGGADDSASDIVGTANFDVSVTPEPSSFLLLATGLAVCLVGFKMRRAEASSAT